MTTIIDPQELHVALLGIAVVGTFSVYQLIQWVRDAPATPDPWDARIQEEIQQPDVIQVCHKCSTPHSPNQWFCEYCGSGVGEYNNVMPYICFFSIGEIARSGLAEKVRINALTITGYLIFFFTGCFITLTPLWFVTPIYWIVFFNKHFQSDNGLDESMDIPPENPS